MVHKGYLSLGISFSHNPMLMQPGLLPGRFNANTPNSGLLPVGVSAPPSAVGAHGDSFNREAVLAGGGNPEAEFQRFKARQYSEIMSHEQAHASAAGSLGGGIHIQYDGNGVAVAGHVPISIPGLDRQNPETSYKNYSVVRSAALAPGDPSGQDMAVASTAQSLMGQAQVLMSRKKQAQSAGVTTDAFMKFGGTPLALEQAKREKARNA